MKASEIQALLDEPACSHNEKDKSACARPKPGATAGGCSFDGAQITLLPIADVAHIVHGPIACAGSSWDNRGTRSSAVSLYRIGMTTDLSETDVVMGRGEKRLLHAIKQAVDSYSPAAVFVYNTCVPALIGDDVEAVCKAAAERWGTPVVPVDAAGFYGVQGMSNALRDFCQADQRRGSDGPHRSADCPRGSPLAGRARPLAATPAGQAGAALHRRGQVVVDRFRAAGSGDDGRRHRHQEVH
ncbi:hypothetical protein ACCAA_50083 [Candidatus Accumulibacter aalborgensis]|uniref:Nitrogenase/oxidoreductase component 1 domain-containing protein n=1 Tax=Candidatus Accumulibacter aalborgensis TaxID=1860102 RepID=A0A1A8XV44_9PROT|nr:hypothetical protein ACCAA_50083 [Candidatus Accumulibacter aalborgensis]